MESNFSAEFFTNNRRHLRELFTGTAPIVLTANGQLQKSADTSFPFRQDSSFWYLTGLDEPDLVYVFDKDKEYLILPPRSEAQNVFDGHHDAARFSETSGIKEILANETGWKRLGSRLAKVKHIATLAALPMYIEQIGLYTNPARANLIERLKNLQPQAELLDLRAHLTHMRMIKQPEEQAALQSAIDTTVQAFKIAKRKLGKLATEYELEALITSEFRKQDLQHGYEPIVASGVNACTLHYIQNNSKLDQRRLVLIDVGAELSHYSADITRTYSFKPPTKRQQAVLEAVLETQSYAFELLKPGVVIKDYELKIHDFIGEKLRTLGLIKSISEESVRIHYPHATSHFLGLDVHDAADYERPLEPGMVLTVEPGIYIPKEGIGIRIEDDVLVTPKGIEILSKKLPRELW
jgi:Xaa-Pro aminopeptidase